MCNIKQLSYHYGLNTNTYVGVLNVCESLLLSFKYLPLSHGMVSMISFFSLLLVIFRYLYAPAFSK